MRSERTSAGYRSLYARLVRLYPAPFRDRFGEQLVQTFGDLCRERQQAGRGLLGLVLRTFAETLAAIARERSATMNPWQNPYVRVALGTAALLLIPLVAMRFTDAVAWDRTDFLVAGALLFGAGAAFVLIARRTSRPGYRAAVGLAVGTGLVLTWMNLAVGLIGSDDDPANLLYGVVFLVGVVGALVARFRPAGMARAMAVAAVALLLVPVVALVFFRPPVATGQEIAGMAAVFGLNAFFALPLIGSAALFWRAGVADQER